jgi:phosphate transport system substrate-binding protein
MNDDFLRRIRVEPPPEFLATLKQTLDRQPLPKVAAPRWRSVLRTLALSLLFGGSAFAIAILSINGVPNTVRRLLSMASSQNGSAATNGLPSTQSSEAMPAVTDSARRSARAPIAITSAGATANAASQGAGHGAPGVPNAVATNDPTAIETDINRSPLAAIPHHTITLAAPKSLQPIAALVWTQVPRSESTVVRSAAVADTTEALGKFCAGGSGGRNSDTFDMATATRRITPAELETCNRNVGAIAEIRTGHQALVLARSNLYGPLNLSPRDLFLALAAEIPDPAHPTELIRNPNTSWSQVNSSLEAEPIKIIGPPISSVTGMAILEILLAPGCDSVPAIAALKETDPDRHSDVCRTLRHDGVYLETAETPLTLFQKIRSYPYSIAIMGYSGYEQLWPSRKRLTVSPVGGILPTQETLSTGSYPGARSLYLYVNQSQVEPTLRNFIDIYVNAAAGPSGPFHSEAASLVVTDGAEAQAPQISPMTLTDLKP